MMETKPNSIFNFATKELSQDAFFAWLINGWNTPVSQPNADTLKDISFEFLRLLYSGNPPFERNEIDSLTVRTQEDRIDVLVDIKTHSDNRYYLIIEDKTNTSVHDNQIQRYINILDKDFVDYEEFKGNQKPRVHPSNPEIKEVSKSNIHAAYVKVSYWNGVDLEVPIPDVVSAVNGEDLRNFLTPYQDVDFLIKDFLENLIQRYLNEVTTAKAFVDEFKFPKKEAFKSAAEDFFFLDKIRALSPQIDKGRIEEGTSSGIPWANYAIWRRKLTFEKNDHYRLLFWRVGSDKNGRYLALRQYEWHGANVKSTDKNKEGEEKKRKEKAFEALKTAVKKVPGELAEKARSSVDTRSAKAKNMESTLVHFTLSEWTDPQKLANLMTEFANAAKKCANENWIEQDADAVGETLIGGPSL